MATDGFTQESFERLSLHDLACLFCGDPSERLDVLVPYIRIGISRGEKCLLFGSPATGNEILAGLQEKGIDIGKALARGAVLVTQGPPRKGFDPEALIAFFHSASRNAASENFSGLRIGMDMSFAGGKALPREMLLDYQRKLHALLESHDTLYLGIYGVGDFPADTLLDALRSHPFVISGGALMENFYFALPSPETGWIEGDEVFRLRISHLSRQHQRLERAARQSLRLSRLRDITLSLLGQAAVPDLLERIVEGVVSLGYRMCWIGMARPNGAVEPVAICGDKEGFLSENKVTWDETPLGNGPTGTAIRKGRPDIIRDVARSHRYAPWRESALARGYHSVAALPLREGDRVAGALTVYAPERDFFDKDAIDELTAFVLQASLVLQRAGKYQKIARSEERLRMLFEQIPAACFTFNRAGTVRHWNMHCRRLYGYSPKQAVGKTLYDLVIPPGEEEKAREIVTRIFSGESALNLERQFRTAGSDIRWCLSNVYPFYGTGEGPEMGIWASVDISGQVESRAALAESEQRFRTAVENVNVVVVEVDPERKAVLFNKAAERITGYAADEVIGQDFLPLFILEPDREQAGASFRDVLAGRELADFVTAIRTKTGEKRILSWNAKGIFNPDGTPQGVVALGIDITERLRAEREREKLRSNLAQTQKMEAIGSIAGGIAHEFNNILGAIIGHGSLLESRLPPDDPSLPHIRRIRQSAERAADLTTKLLGFARRGKNIVRSLSLNDLVASSVHLLSASIDRSIEIVTFPDPLLDPVEGDENQLQHTLLNLCINARDAMPAGGRLTIRTANVRLTEAEAARFHVGGPGKYVCLEIQDTGEGMTEEIRQRIFEPFFTTRQEKGRSGMGLPMVYGIVKNHGGGIQVESAPGKGSCFRLLLPAAERREVAPEASSPSPFPKGTETILVVDDEQAILEMGRELLGVLGYKVLLAENGEEALRIFREHEGRISLVLLDIIMPKMGGKETFRLLRQLDPSLPVLLSSGYTVEGLAQEILNEGANGFIQKPYGMSELARLIRKLLDAPGKAPN